MVSERNRRYTALALRPLQRQVASDCLRAYEDHGLSTSVVFANELVGVFRGCRERHLV